MKDKRVLLAYGDGGKLSRILLKDVLLERMRSKELEPLADSAILSLRNKKVAFTTDSYVVKPIFFPGGDIGRLAVFGTCNDLAVMGAVPRYISVALIIEEGLEMDVLEKVLESIELASGEAGVRVVTGDTKVVERGSGDEIFINTSGIGELLDWESLGKEIEPGDEILLTGTIGDHGMAIVLARGELKLSSEVKSDCASIYPLVLALYKAGVKVKWMRDPTRGGVATVLNELIDGKDFGVEIWEERLRVNPNVDSACEILGLDPIYLANEGKILIVVERGEGDKALRILRENHLGRQAEVIGRVSDDVGAKVVIKTRVGGRRIVTMLSGKPLPRIC